MRLLVIEDESGKSLLIPFRAGIADLEDGRIAIPQALHPYLPGLTHIGGA